MMTLYNKQKGFYAFCAMVFTCKGRVKEEEMKWGTKVMKWK